MSNHTKALELEQPQTTDTVDPATIAGNNFGKLALFFDRANMMSAGQSVCDRRSQQGSITPASGDIWFSFFTGYLGNVGALSTSSQVRVYVTGTAAVGLTLARVGLYTVSSVDQSLTLVASTASDTTLWGTVNTAASKVWQSSYSLAVSQRYALGVIFVGTTPPTLAAAQGASVSSINSLAPRVCGKMTLQSDLPTTVAEASLSSTTAGPFALILP